MTFTKEEERTIKAVVGELLRMKCGDLNQILGSEEIKVLQKLSSKFNMEWYCEKYNIKYEELTNVDFIRAIEEKADEC